MTTFFWTKDSSSYCTGTELFIACLFLSNWDEKQLGKNRVHYFSHFKEALKNN